MSEEWSIKRAEHLVSRWHTTAEGAVGITSLQHLGMRVAAELRDVASDISAKHVAEIEKLRHDLTARDEEIARLRAENEALMERAGQEQQRADKLDAQLDVTVETLHAIRRNSKLWKVGRAGGCDRYQGVPPAMRYIDDALARIQALREGKS